MQPMHRLFIIAIAALALLAGCGQAPRAATAPAPLADSIARAKAAPPAATPAPQLAPTEPPVAVGLGAQSAGVVLLTCYKSGGIAGVSDTWTVYDSGLVKFKGRGGATQLIQLGDAELDALHQLVRGPEFAALGARYLTRGADLFAYELEATGADGALKTVELTLPSDHPAVLDQLIDALEGMRR
jgi:hypothetical protein